MAGMGKDASFAPVGMALPPRRDGVRNDGDVASARGWMAPGDAPDVQRDAGDGLGRGPALSVGRADLLDEAGSIIVPMARDRLLEIFERVQRPAEVASTLEGALTGQLWQQQLLFQAMIDTWPRLQKALREVKLAARKAPWRIEPQARPQWKGLSVEPVSFYLDRLPVRDGSTKVNVAIGMEPSLTTVHYVRPELLGTPRLPWWVRGCSCVGSRHALADEQLKRLGIADGFARQEVEVITFRELCQRHAVTGIRRVLKIDAEGMDKVILRSWLDAAEETPALFPPLVVAEANTIDHDTDPEWLGIVARMRGHGYRLFYHEIDAFFSRTFLTDSSE
jgi:hypothetical protein